MKKMTEVNHVTVQSLLNKMLDETNSDNNETLQMMEFIRDNGVPITSEQAKGMFLLQEMGMDNIATYVMNVRTMMTPVKKFFEMTDKLTLANRIKGTAKLGSVLKMDKNPAGGLNADKMAVK
jgi:hypothetical protein